MRDNTIQFAVVREDPTIEAQLVTKLNAKRILLIGSGGCTAFTLAHRFPSCELTLLDPNPAQLNLIRDKVQHLKTPTETLFNIENSTATGLNACGNFESLFRGFSGFVDEMVCPKEEIRAAFLDKTLLPALRDKLFSSPYWPVAFEMFFCDPLLLAMFGQEAIQHAPKGSYSRHFRNALERGLERDDAFNNYFLHHIFLGYYLARESAQPEYLNKGSINNKIEFLQATLQQVPDFGAFDIVHLSNVFDWMSEGDIMHIANRLSFELHKDAALIVRQLNHDTDFSRYFGSQIAFQPELEKELFSRDRSLFYSKLNIGICQ